MISDKDLRQVQLWVNRTKQEGRFRVLPVRGTFYYDLFKDGIGWCHHSRVFVVGKTRRVVDGEPIPPAILWRLFPQANA